MNCTRVLSALGNHPQPAVMPLDLAMCLSLSQQQPLYQLLSMSPLKPTQCCDPKNDGPPRAILNSPRHSSSSSSSSSSSLPSSPLTEPRSSFRRNSSRVNKKRVVFADANGLALTAVRLFIPEHSLSSSTLATKPFPDKLQGQQSTSNKPHSYKLRLGFPHPMQYIKAFLARLREGHVQLGSCNISEHSLSGKVCVSHDSNEKTVHIRVTFDSWRSHHDIPCTFVQQLRCAGSDMDVFSFDLSLPQNIDPKERIEFCVSLRPGPGATPHWDNNRGLNYRVCMEKHGSNAKQGDAIHYYPMLTKYKPPSWPSHLCLTKQSSVDLYYLHRSLSNKSKQSGKTCVQLSPSEISPYVVSRASRM
ncbi:protein phosphatase 1 regulatory subunit 3C-B [Anabas testudineus]|uniref:protein phosphatase 1 regulatory subunit 3C-B n=1 Tax=Anabas testudineus TaxID=64144 RepID=UPI000E460DFA|nr:protein phosphatase 1 regulatory subunit 3C-B [Anabas testudineus]